MKKSRIEKVVKDIDRDITFNGESYQWGIYQLLGVIVIILLHAYYEEDDNV